ncbi:MAG: hypothetical protein AVO33_02995 [delta proteobacterium ML8_F1]|nr:MAG: hypothetical protein AVO33_02995 [delta proteobacterium ML8_F1]
MTENIVAFVMGMNADGALREKFFQAENVAAIVALAREEGFDFTETEWESKVGEKPQGVLSEEELLQVTGGAAPPDCLQTFSILHCAINMCPHLYLGYDKINRISTVNCEAGYFTNSPV